jgi:hypothetical protein
MVAAQADRNLVIASISLVPDRTLPWSSLRARVGSLVGIAQGLVTLYFRAARCGVVLAPTFFLEEEA